MKKYVFKVVYILNIIVIFLYLLYMINYKYNNKNYKYNTIYEVEANYILRKNRSIFIPKINLKQDVIKLNDEMSNLDNSIAYYNEFNINDKIVIFGHSGVGNGVYFNRLDELNKDDFMYVYNDNYEYLYIVKNVYIINDIDTYILKEEKNSNKVLLVTCYKKDKSKRLVVEFLQKSSKNLIK